MSAVTSKHVYWHQLLQYYKDKYPHLSRYIGLSMHGA
jgi:hypothetical protein